jgi:hypothetical protein
MKQLIKKTAYNFSISLLIPFIDRSRSLMNTSFQLKRLTCLNKVFQSNPKIGTNFYRVPLYKQDPEPQGKIARTNSCKLKHVRQTRSCISQISNHNQCEEDNDQSGNDNDLVTEWVSLPTQNAVDTV